MSQTINITCCLERLCAVSVIAEPLDSARTNDWAGATTPAPAAYASCPEHRSHSAFVFGTVPTTDSDRLFNGSPERYNRKLLGKKVRFTFLPMRTRFTPIP